MGKESRRGHGDNHGQLQAALAMSLTILPHVTHDIEK